ncbi:beta-fructofuranosidase, insoluble isoenzyme CWINV3-like [Lotus japonicus]|uniref:beta-fructofuranosidase, insoluble isoenzyme CWINV3-like n=1 Tax=Lotus japonicus TaxID=34305 RepID=UPI00258D13D6|nr:beta-fructofuranosidase, insoluble isoenzyme CWINV3-like [Lotus japonicus]
MILESSFRQDLDKTTYGTIFDIDPSVKTISLRSLIDHSIIENFGEGGRACITSRVYPSLAIDKDAHLYVFNNGEQSVVITELNAWSMKQAEIGYEGNEAST